MSRKFGIFHDRRHRGARRRPDERSNLAAADIVGLITKTNTNPFFVKMKEGASQGRRSQGHEAVGIRGQLKMATTTPQIAAIENLIAAGAKGILITPDNDSVIVPTLKKARAAGILGHCARHASSATRTLRT